MSYGSPRGEGDRPRAAHTMTRTILAAVIGIAGLCLTAAVGAVLYGSYRESWAARDWPASQCEILSSGMQETEEGWEPRLTWRYEVKGALYEVDGGDPRVFLVTLDKREAGQLVARFARGRRVPCWYDPEDPMRSVLDRNPAPLSALVVGVLIVAMMAGSILTAAVVWGFGRRPGGRAKNEGQ